MTSVWPELTWSSVDAAAGGEARLLAWDGRIDNAADLRWRLASAPDADHATLALHAYRRDGIDGLHALVGDWSVVLLDPARHAVVLASDYMGVRPLYYHVGRGVVRWSANLGALAAATGADGIDEQFIAGFLLYGRCPNRTPYTNIHSVPPGHAVYISPSGTTTRAFWTLPVGSVVRHGDERCYDEQ